MKLPRIALVTPSTDGAGGQAVQAAALVRGLRMDGYTVVLVTIDPAFPRGLRRLRRVPYLRTLITQLLYLPSLARLALADVVHVFSASYWSFVLAPLPAILAARCLGKRVILHYHSGEAADHLERWGMLVHPWLRLVDQIVVPSVYLLEVFRRHGYRAQVIPNIVDTVRFRFRDRAHCGPRLLSARNLESYYRVANTVDAFALLQAVHPEATLTIVGSGTEEPALRRQVATLALRGVTFAGRVPPVEMSREYDAADIFVNSSVVDNQPVSILEAFAAGLPVVSTATGDIANLVIDGETGFVVPAEDPAAMTKALLALLEDPARSREMAHRARRRIEPFQWSFARHLWASAYAGRKR